MLDVKSLPKKILLIVLLVATIVSTIKLFKVIDGFDFQWSPAVLFWEGINPYEYFIDGNKNNRILPVQWPNYAHLTYIVLYPFTLFHSYQLVNIIWGLTNFCLAILSVIILCRHCNLFFRDTIIILFIFLCSTPFRLTIYGGQFSLVVLICFTSFIIKKEYLSNLLLGFSYMKYSFAPPLFFFILFKRGFKAALLSTLVCVLGWIAFSLFLDINPFKTLLQPLKVNLVNIPWPGAADIMSIVRMIFSNTNSTISQIFFYGVPLFLSVLFSWYTARTSGSKSFQLSIISIACLVTFRHAPYDFVLLLPAFIYAYKYRNMFEAKIACIVILFNWFGIRALGLSYTYLWQEYANLFVICNFLINIFLAAIIVIINQKKFKKIN